MTVSTAHTEARRRRARLLLLVLHAAPFGGRSVIEADGATSTGAAAQDAVLTASSSLDEVELRAAWLLGRQRLSAAAEFERAHGSLTS